VSKETYKLIASKKAKSKRDHYELGQETQLLLWQPIVLHTTYGIVSLYTVIAVLSMSMYSFTVSNWSLLLILVSFSADRWIFLAIHPAAKVSEEVNRKCPATNTTVQLSTPCIDPERHNE